MEPEVLIDKVIRHSHSIKDATSRVNADTTRKNVGGGNK
jgi:hypothetical protein